MYGRLTVKRMPLSVALFHALGPTVIGITYLNAPFMCTQRRYTSKSALSRLRSAAFDPPRRSAQPQRGGSSATRGEGAPCGRRVLVTVEVARARMKRTRRKRRAKSDPSRSFGWEEEERESEVTKHSLWPPYRPPKRAADTAKRWNRSISPACANR